MPVNHGRTAKALGIGVSTALLTILFFLCLADIVLLVIPKIPTEALAYIMLTANVVGVFVGGYITAAISGSKGLVMGLICGLIVFVIQLIVSLCGADKAIGALTFIRLGVCILLGILGGIKGVNRKEKLHIK